MIYKNYELYCYCSQLFSVSFSTFIFRLHLNFLYHKNNINVFGFFLHLYLMFVLFKYKSDVFGSLGYTKTMVFYVCVCSAVL